MANQDETAPTYSHQERVASPPPVTGAPQAPVDVESQDHTQARAPTSGGTGFGVPGILRRWKRDDFIRKGSLALRVLALLFSLLAFIIMASNKHGDWREFDKYEEFRYVLAIAILATLYTAVQALRHMHELTAGKEMFPRRTAALADFTGDQIMAYLLISCSSSAIPMINRMRGSQDNLFTDALAASISMAFLAFVTLALSALISGHKLSSQSNI